MKVSILTVCRNSIDTIAHSLNSVSHQSYDNIEHIVIDGYSTDGTYEFLLASSPDRFTLKRRAPKGIYDAINYAISVSSGDIVGVLHSDDVFASSNVISDVVDYFESSPSLCFISGNVEFYKDGVLFRCYCTENFRPWMLRFGFMPAHTATFVKRRLYELIGTYDVSFVSAADFDFFIRAIMHYKLPYKVVNSSFVSMSYGGTSTSGLYSYMRTTIELLKAHKKNKIYSNLLFVLVRLPIKFLIRKIRCNENIRSK